ncbi:MAG: ribonuclease P protein component [bacterium]|nr:ribonuclease P protein component [bacterium]
MLSKANRLDIKKYFSQIRGNGKKLTGIDFAIYYRLGPNQTKPGISTVISKKVTKSAVKRNRMRRLIHTAMTHMLHSLSPNFQCIFFVYHDFSLKKSQDLTDELINIFTKANLLNQSQS